MLQPVFSQLTSSPQEQVGESWSLATLVPPYNLENKKLHSMCFLVRVSSVLETMQVCSDHVSFARFTALLLTAEL